ncbi:MAG: hypothetical protein ACXVCY_15005 [Pseudobdellovibrionaceae bacterium]
MTKEMKLNGNGFSEYQSENGLIAWIDVLGVERLSKQRLLDLFKIFPDLGSIVASTKQGDGTHKRNVLANTLTIGDAICIAQRDDLPHAREAVAAVALYVSVNLYNQGFPNRGFITSGELKTGISHGETPYIIGSGVVRAVRHESKLKVAGLAIDQALNEEALTWRLPDGLDRFYFTGRLGEYTFLSGNDHLVSWKKYVDEHYSEHSYLAAAKILTDSSSTWIKGNESYMAEKDY